MEFKDKEPTEMVGTRLKRPMYDKLLDICNEKLITKSWAIQQIVEDFLKNYKGGEGR